MLEVDINNREIPSLKEWNNTAAGTVVILSVVSVKDQGDIVKSSQVVVRSAGELNEDELIRLESRLREEIAGIGLAGKEAGWSIERRGILSPRQREALELARDGLVNKEIAEQMGIGEQTVRDKAKELSTEKFLGTKPLKLAKFTDFDEEDGLRPIYNVWTFGKKTNEVSHFGNSEQRILDNLLYLYTEPFDIVLDVFGGGGSTIDVCKNRLRRYWISDRKPIIERENEMLTPLSYRFTHPGLRTGRRTQPLPSTEANQGRPTAASVPIWKIVTPDRFGDRGSAWGTSGVSSHTTSSICSSWDAVFGCSPAVSSWLPAAGSEPITPQDQTSGRAG